MTTSAAVIAALYQDMGGQVRESVINGIWYEALRIQFPSPAFIIAPEYYTPLGTRVDLCVLERVPGGPRPVFAFEGKQGPMNQTQWTADVGQAAGYISQMTPLHNGRRYGMLASGDGFIILEYTPGGGQNQVLKVTGANLASAYNTTPWDAYAQRANVDAIVGAIAQVVAHTA
ncbi:hypothetical protein B0T26DRAFT_752848 [Lasiosphaeria miniovina]|uniref:Uncharacterized protein n=1 Tax=Lasiosphaeria miniovina TaxID=1954250 RepID=A0AA40AB59_9PEZI|nr:uncharacterized protein B0T26DRAFT_752848 [Lasiosphaeria miniovina]KAK0712636.1 hypothetical protein B0T26DRAFT_752848 [Lasiosphaeria miniovina]